MTTGARAPLTPRILVLCTGNSCRSQIAEAWFRRLGADRVDVFSAGSRPAGRVDPRAVRVMAEAGVDIAGQRSKSVAEFLGEPFDYVITVCDDAAEVCPVFPGPARRIHWSLPDPAKGPGDEATQLGAFRQVRDELHERIEEFLRTIPP
jgi:arsenate reductase